MSTQQALETVDPNTGAPQVVADFHDALDETFQDDGSEHGSDQEIQNSRMDNVSRRSAPTNSIAPGHIQVPADFVQSMMDAMNDLRAQIGQLQNQQLSQQQVVVAPIVAPAVPTQTTNPVPAGNKANNSSQHGANMRATPSKPKEFNGSKKDPSPQEFLNQLFLYFANVNLSDKEMATCAASYMVGGAGTWAATRLKTLKQEGKVDSWTQFESDFRKLYCPANGDQLARGQLMKLRQDKDSVGEYYQEFERLALQVSNLEESFKLDIFMKGLRWKLYEKVYLQQPKTMREAYESAAQLEGMYQILATNNTSFASKASSSSMNVMEGEEEPKQTNTTQLEQQVSQLTKCLSTVQLQQQQLSAMFQQRKSNNGRQNDEKDKLVCAHCGKKRHTKEQCWKLHPELKRAKGWQATIAKK